MVDRLTHMGIAEMVSYTLDNLQSVWHFQRLTVEKELELQPA